MLILDGNHLTKRCAATLDEMCTHTGERSGVIYGFLKGLMYAKGQMNILETSDVLVCWDSGRCARRMEIHPEYKGNRKRAETEEEQLEFLDYCKQLQELQTCLSLLGVRQVKVPGMEADDLVGIFSNFFSKYTNRIIIYSGDHDMHQLVTPKISILDAKKGLLGEREVFNLWCLPSTEHILYYSAMTGDKSDNIHGIPKIGDKRALHVLRNLDFRVNPPVVKPNVDPAHKEWVDLYLANQELIKKNISLIKIPRDWSESYYTVDQQISAMEQVANVPQRDDVAVLQFLQRWELASVVQIYHRL